MSITSRGDPGHGSREHIEVHSPDTLSIVNEKEVGREIDDKIYRRCLITFKNFFDEIHVVNLSDRAADNAVL